MKTFLKVVGGLIALLLIVAIALPFFINVDQFRPQIVDAVNQQVNGKVEIGKLGLSLWGRIEIKIDGVKVEDKGGNQLLAVEEAYAFTSFAGFISGSPRMVIRLVEPNVNVVMDKNGKLNLLSLVKEKTPEELKAAEEAEKAAKATAAKDKLATETAPASAPPKAEDIPMFDRLASAGLDFEMRDFDLSFIDQSSGFVQKLDDFNLLLKDVSMSRTMTLEMWSDIETRVGKDMSVTGPFRIEGSISPRFEGLQFTGVGTEMALIFDDIKIEVPETFQKAKGQPANIKFAVDYTEKKIDLSNMEIRFLEAVAKAKGEVLDLMSPPEKGQFSLSMDYPGVDLKVDANFRSIAAPYARVKVRSSGIDLDKLFPPPPGGRKKLDEQIAADMKTKKEAPKNGAGGDKKASDKSDKSKDKVAAETVPEEPATDVDAALDPLRMNPMLKGMDAGLDLEIASVTGFFMDIRDIKLTTSFKQLRAAVDQFAMKIYGGSIQMNAAINLQPAMPTYDFNFAMDNIMLDDAVASQFAMFQNTLRGRLTVEASGKGESLNADKMVPNFDMKGTFSFADAAFKTMDITKIVGEGVEQSWMKIVEKVPLLKGKDPKKLADKNMKFKYAGSKFTMQNGVVDAPDFKAEAYPNESVDIAGRTKLDLVKDGIDAEWSIVDTYNLFGLHDIHVDQTVAGRKIRVAHVLAENGEPIRFPVTVGCKLSEPCVDYASIPKHFTNVAKKNIEGVASDLLDAEKARLKAKLEAEKAKLRERAEAERKKQKAKFDKAKAEQEARLAKKRAEAEEKARKEKEAAKEKASNKAKDEGKKALKKLGF